MSIIFCREPGSRQRIFFKKKKFFLSPPGPTPRLTLTHTRAHPARRRPLAAAAARASCSTAADQIPRAPPAHTAPTPAPARPSPPPCVTAASPHPARTSQEPRRRRDRKRSPGPVRHRRLAASRTDAAGAQEEEEGPEEEPQLRASPPPRRIPHYGGGRRRSPICDHQVPTRPTRHSSNPTDFCAASRSIALPLSLSAELRSWSWGVAAG